MVSKKKPADNSAWFKQLALTVREIVVAHGGAIAMTKQELQDAIREEDSMFQDCPSAVMDHPTLPLSKWSRLQVTGFKGKQGDILLIHYANMPVGVARARCRSNGLSEAVNIALLEGVKA